MTKTLTFANIKLLQRSLMSLALALLITACGSAVDTRQAQIDMRIQAERDAADQREAIARAAQERQVALQREELARQRQEEQQREAEARAREEEAAAQRAIAEAEQRRLRAIADQQRQRQAELERIARLEREIAAAEEQARTQALANQKLAEAITAAEELLQMLSSEQAKYDNLDINGRPVDPLQKSLIAELEERKNSLIREAGLQ